MRTRHKVALYLLLALMFCVFAYCVPAQSQEDSTYSALALPVLTEAENQILDTARDDLAALAELSATAKELLEFYDAHAVRAKYVDSRLFEVVEPLDSPLDFFIVANPNPIPLLREEDAIFAEFFCESRSVILATCGFGPLVRGLCLAHEIVHARDCTDEDGEIVAEPLSDLWLFEEYEAHHTVFMVINEMTNGKWLEAAQESAKQRQRIMAESNEPYAYTMGPVPSDEDLIRNCVSIESPLDAGFYATDMIVSANMLMIEQCATSDEEFGAGMIDLLFTLYSDFDPLQERLE
ncbi:MAG: hypothetical protein WC857_03820 [Candidatus Paceibacterota bacterium]|jgi:hypothetical protein